MKNHIRPIAVALINSDNKILVFEGRDHVKGETFFRPLGGSIEFGEHSMSAVCREFKEEIDSDINNITYMGMLENVFEYEGITHHEIVIVYEAELADKSLYKKKSFTGREDDGSLFNVRWMPLTYFKTGQAPLYPDGLLDMISGHRT